MHRNVSIMCTQLINIINRGINVYHIDAEQKQLFTACLPPLSAVRRACTADCPLGYACYHAVANVFTVGFSSLSDVIPRNWKRGCVYFNQQYNPDELENKDACHEVY